MLIRKFTPTSSSIADCERFVPKHHDMDLTRFLVPPMHTRIAHSAAAAVNKPSLSLTFEEFSKKQHQEVERNGHSLLPPTQLDRNWDQLLENSKSFASLASLLKRCGKAKALTHGRLVHAHIRRCKYDRNTFLGNCLVEMYGNCGRMEDAQAMFDNLFDPNLYSWTILIKAYAKNACGREALECFHQMQCQGFKPNPITFVCALDACTGLAALEMGRQIHAAIVERGFEGQVFVATALITMYGKCGSLEDAKNVFNRMTDRNVVSWTAMISAYAQNGHSTEALYLFDNLHHQGIKPNKVTFICALDACANVSALEKGRQMHAAILDCGYEGDLVVGTALVSMYGKCRSLQDARAVFSQMPSRNLVSWNAMIAACTQNGHSKEALDLFNVMQNDGFEPNPVTFVCIIDACASLAALEKGQEIHAAIVDSGHEEQVIVGNALVNMYGKCGDLDAARSIFGQMPNRNSISWNAMISACTQNGHAKEALDFFNEMDGNGFKPDHVTFVCALDACAILASLEKGQEIHDVILERGYERQVDVGTALVNMYSKCGMLHEAKRVFGQMFHRNVISWNVMIAACAQNGHEKEALDLYHQMRRDGVKPDHVTFVSLLTACSHAGLLDDGRKYFDLMRQDHDVTQKVEHYACMIDILCRAGCLRDAEDLITTIAVTK